VSVFIGDVCVSVCLQPHLHTIVNRSMELARTAKEPFNYFLLLRALFRSIGGGSHDLLYQEFLPLLPSLLQGYILQHFFDPLNFFLSSSTIRRHLAPLKD